VENNDELIDLPRIELMERADQAILQTGGPDKACVYFKYTCAGCGERCMLSKQNTLYEYGECHVCGHSTFIEKGGFLLKLTLK
jgi:hypothetical protein